MILSNTETIPGRTITHHVGLVQGNTVLTKFSGGAELLACRTAVL